MLVSDIYQEVKGVDILGVCDDETIYARLSDAVRLIANMGIMDPAIGEMSLCVCDGHVTLPAEVGTVLAVNQGGQPSILRDQWFQYHANGTGTVSYGAWNYTDVTGEYSTYRDPSGPVQLVAQVESPRDSNKELRVFGWDADGKRIYTLNSDGDLQDGMLVPTVYGFSHPNPDAPFISRIDRVQKDVWNGFCRLLAVNADGSPHTQIGYYQPYETNPRYQRVRVIDRNWLKIKYRKRTFEVRSKQDWINVDNKEALMMAIKACNLRRKSAFDEARNCESECSRLLDLEAQAKRPPGISPMQVVWNEGIPATATDCLFY